MPYLSHQLTVNEWRSEGFNGRAGRWTRTFNIATTYANEAAGQLHDRIG